LNKKIRNTKLGIEEHHDFYCSAERNETGWECRMRVIEEEPIVL